MNITNVCKTISCRLLLWSVFTISLSLLSTQLDAGNNYYFSSSNGDDSRTPAQAKNPATPWKSINKLNSYFNSLLPGDSALFKRGEIFYGSILVSKSGTSTQPIVIGSFGTGTKPVITAFKTISGWTNLGGNIWESSVTNCKPTLNIVTVNGINTPIGRYPNTGYLSYESFNGYTSITDNELTNSPNWTGAEVVIKKREWIIDRCLISSHSNKIITYTNSSTNPGKAGWGYFIQNDPKTLDKTGEWFLNKSTKKLRMYFSGNNPNSHLVKASTLDTLVYCADKNYLTFANINFEGGNIFGFYLHSGSKIKILNCEINYIGRTAVYYPGNTFLTVDGCIISNTNDHVMFGSSTSTNAYVGHNTIKNTGIIPGNAGTGDGHNFGISIQANNCIAEYNTIVNSGYFAIIFGGNNTIVRYNSIDSSCLVKNDGAAIYASGTLPTVMSNRIVEYNVIRNTIGNSEGNAGVYPSARGIYVDQYGNNVTIRNNTVINSVESGIYLAYYSNHINVFNNTLYNNRYNMYFVELDAIPNNYVINGNILISTGNTTDLMRANNTGTYNSAVIPYSLRPAEEMGTWDGNYYIKPFDDNGIFRLQYTTPKIIYDCFTVNGWSQYDVNMKSAPVEIVPYTINSLLGSNKVTNGTYTNNTAGTTMTYYGTGQLTWDNTNKINGGSAKISYSMPLATQWSTCFIKIPIGSVQAGKKYICKFDIVGTKPNRAISARLALPSTNTPLTPEYKYYPYTNTGATTNEILFEPTASATTTNLYLTLRDEDGTVYIDNVTFYEADVTKANPDDLLRFEYNASSNAKTIALNGTYIGLNSTVHSGSVTIQPYSSVILFKDNSANHTPVINNQALQVAENSAINTIIGTVIATDPDPNQVLTFSILSGNTNGTFAINSSTGVLTVANKNALNFEATPSFTLTIKVQDNGTGNLSSHALVTVALLNINEAPIISNQSFSIVENSVNGATIGTIIATDPDAGQTKTFSIISGNTGGIFTVNSSTGVIKVANSLLINPQITPSYALVVKVQDNGQGLLNSQATITVNIMAANNCSATGNITYQVWNNLGTSTAVSSLTSIVNYPNNPTSTVLLTSMEGPTDQGDIYGARIVGYICAPSTGSYTFWIASDNEGELWLSTNDQTANKQKIAYHNGYTSPRQWTKYASQKSVAINLIQGQKYYIEALMKEVWGTDNLAVGWLKPGQTGTVPSEVIPGSVLSPFTSTVLVNSVNLPATNSGNVGNSVTLQATVLPGNATISTLSWSSSNSSIATVNNNGQVSGIATGSAIVTATSTDGSNKSGTCLVTVNSQNCSATGNIIYQVWNNLGNSTAVSSLTSNVNYPNNPTSTVVITSMEGPTNQGDVYGARIAGYICAPTSGSYTFWIASDNEGELWLSTNDQPANKQKIAYHNGYTSPRQWTKYASQKSVEINLIQGQKYYIEALMKEVWGTDNLAVGWLKPGQTGTVPSEVIPGSVLSPIAATSMLVTNVALPATTTVNVGAPVMILATVLPGNANNSVLSWTTSNPSIVTVGSNGLITGIAAGTAIISATSTDGSNITGTSQITVVLPPCNAAGNITYQMWNNIGNSVTVSSLTSNINYPDNPSSSISITAMEATSNQTESYGARIAGYICAPATGSYTFWIASDDYGELWFSTSDQPANKQKIAYVNGYTSSRQWNKYTSQKSVVINLVQGKSYYIEALMKEATGGDNFAIGWLKPGQTGTEPSEVIPGTVLSPLENIAKSASASNYFSEEEIRLLVFPNPLSGNLLSIKLENVDKDVTVRIYSASGILCHEQEFNNSVQINLDRDIFKNGIYILKVFNDSILKTSKLVIK